MILVFTVNPIAGENKEVPTIPATFKNPKATQRRLLSKLSDT